MNVEHWKSKFLKAPEGEGGGGSTTDAGGTGTPGGEGGQGEGGQGEGGDGGQTGPDLSFIGQDFHGEDGKPDFTKFSQHYQDMLAEKTQRDEALALVPENGEYEFALPEDFELGVELPEGVEIQLDTESEHMKPLFGELGAFLKANSLPAEAGPQMMGLLKKYEATRYAANLKAAEAEYEKLGPNEATRDARIGRVDRALESRLPKEQAAALKLAARSPDAVKALEALLQPRGPQSAASVPKAKTTQDDLNAYYGQP